MKQQMSQVIESKEVLLKQFEGLQKQSEKSKEEFIRKLKESNENMISNVEEIRKQISQMEINVSIVTSKNNSNYNYIQEL